MNIEALSAYLQVAARAPAKFGGLDCVRFVSECLRIGWDRDFTHMLQYHDRRSAVDRLRRDGGLIEAMIAVFGQDIPISDLEPGDIACFPDPTIGIILPSFLGGQPAIIAVKFRRTILRLPLSAARSGWKTWVR